MRRDPDPPSIESERGGPRRTGSARNRGAIGDLVEGFRAGRPTALARAISIIEDQSEGFEGFLHRILDGTGPGARRIGITGPPGAGKSTLVAALARRYRKGGDRVGVLAVDPSSPFSGGALLGDRIRMQELAGDEGTYVRSMASRGGVGGLATTSHEVVDLMDAFGFPWILVETMGVGQVEIDVASAADSVVVALVPESGDGVQAMKAGLLEIPDLIVVNKRDRVGADALAEELRTALRLRDDGGRRSGWDVPVLLTDARSEEGVAELVEALERHREYLEASGELERRRSGRAASRIRGVLERRLRRQAARLLADPAVLEAALERIGAGEATPYSVADGLLPSAGPAGGETDGER